MNLLIIGGARFSGRALSGLALERGHQVTMFHRGGGSDDPWPAAEHVHADRKEGFSQLEGRSFDAVIDMCAYVPREVREAALAFPGAATYCFISSLSAHVDQVRPYATEEDDVHQPPFPDTEEVTNETYGPLKVACERALEASYGERALLVRPGYIVGPYDPTDRFTYWVRRAARGGRMLAPGEPSYPMQWIDARDLAAFVLSLVERGASGPFSVVTPPGKHTMGELLQAARDEAGADTAVEWVDQAFIERAGLLDPVDDSDPFPLWTPREPGAHLFDTSKAEAAGLVVRPLADTVRDTLAWDVGRGAPWPLEAGLADEAEDRLLTEWSAGR